MFDLKGNIALITGASAGIGEACAREMARAGADLILAARRVERLEAMKESLTEEFDVRCYVDSLDVRDRDNVKAVIANIPPEFKDVTILVNNAGLASGLDPIASADYDDWDRMIDTNIKGLLTMTREILPGMIERGRGHVINIGSIAGRQPYPNGGVYCSTKFAVRALTQGLLMDLVGTPIRVSTVDPGLVETEFSAVRFHGDNDRAKTVYEGLKALEAVDIADAVVYVASRPAHVNISEMVVLPKDQASAYHVNREG
jgi:serine 3-dehydrogenase